MKLIHFEFVNSLTGDRGRGQATNQLFVSITSYRIMGIEVGNRCGGRDGNLL